MRDRHRLPRRRGWLLPAAGMVVALIAAACGGPEHTVDGVADAAPRPSSEVFGTEVALPDLCRQAYADHPDAEDLQVGLVTDSGGINDGTFNQYAYEGMVAAARCFGFDTSYLASGSLDNYADHLDRLIQDGSDAIVTVGFWLTEMTDAAARAHPDVHFVGVDQPGNAELPNYAGVQFRDDQAGFLAGAAAGLLTTSGTVGVVAGPDSVEPVMALTDGFRAGVQSVAQDVTTLVDHLPSFSDPDAGAAVARDFVARGADVVYGPAGLTGVGAIRAAAAENAWVIGVDQDQYYTTFEGGAHPGAERLATSSVKRVDLGVFAALADVVAGEPTSGPNRFDAATGGIAYAPAHDAALPDGVAARLARIYHELAAGAQAVAAAQPGG